MINSCNCSKHFVRLAISASLISYLAIILTVTASGVEVALTKKNSTSSDYYRYLIEKNLIGLDDPSKPHTKQDSHLINQYEGSDQLINLKSDDSSEVRSDSSLVESNSVSDFSYSSQESNAISLERDVPFSKENVSEGSTNLGSSTFLSAKKNLTEEEIQKITHQAGEVAMKEVDDEKLHRAKNGRSMKHASSFSSLFRSFYKVLDFKRVAREIETSLMTSMSCTACKAGVGILRHYIGSGRQNAEIAKAATKLCINFNMQSPRVCHGIIALYVDEVVEVLKDITLSSQEICIIIIGESCGHPDPLRWSVTFPPIPKPPYKGFPVPKKSTSTLKVLQISDTHWDPFYTVGSNAECHEPLCCRVTSGPKPPRYNMAAGLWGDYRKCDPPKWTIESMFSHISEEHPDIDYILWTGDIPPHDVWNQTKAENVNIIKETVELMLQYFPQVPIFPALGNHESVPVNSFAPPWVKNPKFTIGWLYEELEKEWSRWLPSTTASTIKKGAYYSTIIKPGFKLISLNTNYCNSKNWWLLVNGKDPVEELKWLIFELQSSELIGEKVHIIGHIPPGHADCMATWSRNYYNIVSRYEATIMAQFFGHTHFDEMELFYAKEDIYRPGNVAYIGPSVTPYDNLNPGYRIYYVDGDHQETTRTVLDHETWVTDLGKANRDRAHQLDWYKLYSAKKAYGLESLSPQNWDNLVMSMYQDRNLFNMYYRFYYKNSPVAPSCDEACRKRLLCDIRSGRSNAKELLCKPRPTNVRSSRVDDAPSPGFFSRILSSISSTFSSIFSMIVLPFGFR